MTSDSINEGWLSEGFADFTKVLALEEAFGRPEAVRMLQAMCLRDFGGRSMTTRDFIEAALACLPGPDVQAFMQEHLYGRPQYEIGEGGRLATRQAESQTGSVERNRREA
ncbi:MAG: hypothetical protein WD024_06735 [Bacillota bacterium]